MQRLGALLIGLSVVFLAYSGVKAWTKVGSARATSYLPAPVDSIEAPVEPTPPTPPFWADGSGVYVEKFIYSDEAGTWVVSLKVVRIATDDPHLTKDVPKWWFAFRDR